MTENELSKYAHVGTHRVDLTFRVNGDTDLEFAEFFKQGDEANMIARVVYVVARAIHEHGGKPK
jgi:hypothetical protein